MLRHETNDVVAEVIEIDFEMTPLEKLAEEVRALREQQEEILTVIRAYGDQLAPTLDGMKSSPIGKLFGM